MAEQWKNLNFQLRWFADKSKNFLLLNSYIENTSSGNVVDMGAQHGLNTIKLNVNIKNRTCATKILICWRQISCNFTF